MDRNRQLLRVLKILHDLIQSGSAYTIKQLAVKFRVHPKTIRRDLKAIEEAPFGLTKIDGEGEQKFTTKKRYRLTNDS